jgi:hypothetical protein
MLCTHRTTPLQCRTHACRTHAWQRLQCRTTPLQCLQRGSPQHACRPCQPGLHALQVDAREVTAEEGSDFAKAHGLMYRETSTRTDQGVYDALVWGLVCTIVDTPELLRSHGSNARGQVVNLAADDVYEEPRRPRGKGWCCA